MAKKIDYEAMAKEMYDTFMQDKLNEFFANADTQLTRPGRKTKETYIPNKGTEYETVCPYCGLATTNVTTSSYVPYEFTCTCGEHYHLGEGASETVFTAFRKDAGTVIMFVRVSADAEFAPDGKFVGYINKKVEMDSLAYAPDSGSLIKWEISKSGTDMFFVKTTKRLSRMMYYYRMQNFILLDGVTQVRGVPILKTNGAYSILESIESACKTTRAAKTTPASQTVVTFEPEELEISDITDFLVSINEVDNVNNDMKCQCWCKCGHVWEGSYKETDLPADANAYYDRKGYIIKCPNCGEIHYAEERNIRYNNSLHKAVIQIYDNDVLNTFDAVFSDYYIDNEWNLTCEPKLAFRIDKNTKKVVKFKQDYNHTGWNRTTCQEKYSNYNELILSDSLKYSGLKEAWEAVSGINYYYRTLPFISIPNYIVKWMTCPAIEQGVKRNAKLARLIWDSCNGESNTSLNLDAKNSAELFSIPERLMKFFCKDDTTISMEKMQLLYKTDNNVTEQSLEWISKNSINENSVIRLYNMGISFQDITDYLERVRKVQYVEPYAAVGEWADYLVACEAIGTDLTDKTVKYPRHLLSEHNIVINKRKLINDANKDEAFKQRCDKYAKLFNYKDKNIIVKAPESIQELLEEGRKLHHCVGSYADRIIDGQNLIFFIRKAKEPDTPWLTVDISDGGQILELRGKLDQMATPAEKKLLADWVDKKNLIGGRWL